MSYDCKGELLNAAFSAFLQGAYKVTSFYASFLVVRFKLMCFDCINRNNSEHKTCFCL